MDDRLLERLGVDTRYVWPGASPSSPAMPTSKPGTLLDGYGQPWVQSLPYYYPTEGILSGATLDQIDELVSWPDPADPRWTHGTRERASQLGGSTDYFVIARMVTSHGPFTTASSLRGTEGFMVDMAEDPEFAHALIQRVTDAIGGLLRVYLEACGSHVDMIELPGDDYASNTNLIVSPRMFREFIKPQLVRLVKIIREYRSDLKIMFHSDGLVEKLLPDFIEMGIDVIHPLEPVQLMDQDRVKQEYGEHISFLGGIDITTAMRGGQEDVIEEVRIRIRQLAPGGGYILSPSNHLQEDVPPQNVVTLFDAARLYGAYPIQI
jgi:uroporphyrinogen decarboxylase